MIDPELKYCPDCRDEYRADIERCGVCGRQLITGQEMLVMEESGTAKRASRKGALTEADEIVTIQKAPLADIRILQELLEAERIGTRLAGDDKNCGGGCCPSTFELQVRLEDAQDAAAIIAEEYRRATALDGHGHQIDGVFNADAGQATCPACGHTFPTFTSTCPDCGLCFG